MIKRFLVWLNYTLQDLEDAQGWRPIQPSLAEMLQKLEELTKWKKSLGVHCAMYGHRCDQWFDGGVTCLTCGAERPQPVAAERPPTERERRVDSMLIALQLSPESIAEAKEIRRRIDETVKHIAVD